MYQQLSAATGRRFASRTDLRQNGSHGTGTMTLDRELRADAAETRERRTTRTRPALCNALLSLLQEQPFEQVTIRDITARAGVGYATFFRHYPDKEALLQDATLREIRQLLGLTLPILYTVDSRASTQALCAYVWEHRKLWSALLTGGAAATLKEEYVREAQRLAAKQEAFGTWLPGDLRVVFSVSASIDILAWWLKQADPPSVNVMAEIIDKLTVIPAITPPAGT
jgi:AcrR family transcriptional regulator